jgi:hypothetical protein
VRGRGQFAPMKSLIRAAVALLAAFTFSFAAVPDDIRQNLDKLVAETIRLIEAKEFVTVLETLFTPDALKRRTAIVPIDVVAVKWGEVIAPPFLVALKTLKDTKPKFSDDGNTATFDWPNGPESLPKFIVFIRIEGRWYIKS